MSKYSELIKRAVHPKEWRGLYKEYKELCNYFIFGVLTTLVSFVTYYIFRFAFPDSASVPEFLRWIFTMAAVFGAESETALPVVLSWIFSVTFAYITNRIWVFESKARGFLRVTAEALSFYGARVLTLLLDMLIMYLMVDLPGLHNVFYEFFARCVSSVFVLVMNYVFSKLFVFRHKKDEKKQ